jgi:hypothetical protein
MVHGFYWSLDGASPVAPLCLDALGARAAMSRVPTMSGESGDASGPQEQLERAGRAVLEHDAAAALYAVEELDPP